MTCAIVLSCYNGEKFITEQMESLLRQRRQPDRVVIWDDGSGDTTPLLVESFIREHQLSNWSFHINAKNAGWKKNFHDLILSVEEDIIFPSDQDDIWHAEKLDEMCRILETRPEIDLLACGYVPQYDDNTRHITKEIQQSMNESGRVEKLKMDERFMYVLRPGCTFAVRRDFCRAIAPAWDVALPHDAMIWRCAIAKGTAYLYQKSLITWRRYNASSSNPNSMAQKYTSKAKLMLDFYVDNNDSHLLFLNCLQRLIKSGVICPDEETKRILRENAEFEKTQRAALLSRNPLRPVLCALRYRRYYLTKKSVLAHAYVTMMAR